MPRLTIDITDELANALLSRRVDAVGVCLTALNNSVKESDSMDQPIPAKPKRPGPGRPPGLTREQRNINLEPWIWEWLEKRALPGEKFNATCNRVLSELIKSSEK